LIEVEIDNHSFSAHVLPQMAKLSFAKADQSVINKVSDAFEGEFHFDKIQSLLEKKPIVYLVTHGNTEKYQDKLDELYVSSIDIEIHSCPPGDYVIEVNDRSKKYLDTGWQAIRSRSPLLKNLWNISSFESEIPSDLGGQIAVEYENTISIWSFEKFGSSLALRAPADLPMSPHIDKVEVYKQKDAWVFKMKVNDHIDRSNNAAKNG
jgi:hypothetical protein